MSKRKSHLFLIFCLLITMMAGCGRMEDSGTVVEGESTDSQIPQIQGLTYESSMELQYAQGFAVYYYQDGYALIEIQEGERYLVVPEGKSAPEGVEEDITILQKPLDHIYLAGTSAMALFDSLDALENIRMSGIEASGWYVEHAKQAMEDGEILYAGKYSEPDYEMLLDEGCNLAIESTMILHTPKVKEMLEDLDIPVLIDRSSYEPHPLGRTEWIKLYGVLTDREQEAEAFFEKQAEVMDSMEEIEDTGKTVVFFYLNTDGTVVVRKSDDYIPAMIEIAGGHYVFADLENTESNSPSVDLTMEEFYSQAVDADYLIYNAAIDNPIQSIDELVAKNELFADFKAVKEGNVWCTGKYLYQATDKVGNLITDIHLMLTDQDESGMLFLYKVQ